MPTSALGSKQHRPGPLGPRRAGGFSLVELLVVFAIIALGVGMVVLALPDGDEAKLEEEGARLGALLEMARAEARVAGVAVRWVPRADNLVGASAAGNESSGFGTPGSGNPGSAGASGQFAFTGLPGKIALPTRWLDSRTQAQVRGASFLLLGPDAILPPQAVTLRLGSRTLELATDGLAPFSPALAAEPGAGDAVSTRSADALPAPAKP